MYENSLTLTHSHSLLCTPKCSFKETHQCLPYFGELWHAYPCCLSRPSLPSSTKSRWGVEPHVLLSVSFNCVFEVTATVKQWHRMVKMKATAHNLGPSQVLDGLCCGVLNSLWVGVADPSHRGPGVLLFPTSLSSSAIVPQGTTPFVVLAHLPARR